MKIVCLGDSLTYGYGVPRAFVWTRLAEKELSDSMMDISIRNKGVSGEVTGAMAARFDRDVSEEQPDLLFFMGGSNDIFFLDSITMAKQHVRVIISKARERKIPVILGIPFPICRSCMAEQWRGYADRADVEELLEEWKTWLFEFAGEEEIPVIDFQECFGGDDRERDDCYLDGIHPGKETQKRIADCFVKAIRGI